ncbi:winged helix-turn-helix domain-containing protein [Alphaproteobacteria bacterium KMM 3653]|uniref:Winged helix-turn-helix domain-containing protein n=1 Tax=Harenicola maris TaxID=2841044 RepID=A0AAP2CLV7_9RHOB|nr:winged helix-turn-helix domain-containing protein [Harenicola maris]
MPSWVPAEVHHYLAHIEAGHSIRDLARQTGLAPSTVSRQIRRFEQRRDCRLVDAALNALAQNLNAAEKPAKRVKESMEMTQTMTQNLPDETTVKREARRILRRMSEPGAVLAVAPDLAKSVVVRTLPDGTSTRTAVVDSNVAQAFALKDWIGCDKPGKIAQYHLKNAGKMALKRMLAAEGNSPHGGAGGNGFAEQHSDWGTREMMGEDGGAPQRITYNRAESPVGMLARRRDKDGTPFLGADLLAAADRLREDFELAQMGPRVTQNWDNFLTAGTRGSTRPGTSVGPEASRDRVTAALRDLGPGLGDMVLRCCCFLEGLEATEKRMGWSARSGKIVLRIALQRLKRHYEETYGPGGGLVG